jgi:hypothetical protein
MAEINIGQISEALNDKSDRDLRNVDTTAKADAVIDYQEPTSANGYTWYRKYKSGWVEQGGIQASSSGASGVTVTLPVAMTDANYTIVATISEQDYFVTCLNKTTTSFKFRSVNFRGEGYDRAGSWYVSGKSAN